jgi:GNAT superfamily N-acetyltransferase
MTTEKYRALMNAPDYDPAMDVVILAPDGRYAAFALGWTDTQSKMGLFEPVGTRRAFQRLGLGKAALHEAMRRMQMRGIEIATVRTTLSLPGVLPFYQAAGFQIMNTIWCYEGFATGSDSTTHQHQ